MASRFLMKNDDTVWIKCLGLVLNSALYWICQSPCPAWYPVKVYFLGTHSCRVSPAALHHCQRPPPRAWPWPLSPTPSQEQLCCLRAGQVRRGTGEHKSEQSSLVSHSGSPVRSVPPRRGMARGRGKPAGDGCPSTGK